MPISDCISSVPLSNGDVFYYGRQIMIVPSGGNVVRQCSQKVKAKPTVLCCWMYLAGAPL
jgi:hypothetical protein